MTTDKMKLAEELDNADFLVVRNCPMVGKFDHENVDRYMTGDEHSSIVAALRAPEAADAYREAVDTEMMLCHLGIATGDAKKDLHAIINWNVDVALDPRVSERARTLQASAADAGAALANEKLDDIRAIRAPVAGPAGGIAAPPASSTFDGRILHAQYDGNGNPRPVPLSIDAAPPAASADAVRETLAEKLQQFWQSPSGRTWNAPGDEKSCCVLLPAQADWFRRLADVAIATPTAPPRPPLHAVTQKEENDVRND